MPVFLRSELAADALTRVSTMFGAPVDGRDVGPVAGLQPWKLFTGKQAKESAYILAGMGFSAVAGYVLANRAFDEGDYLKKAALVLVCLGIGFKKVHDDVIVPIKEYRAKLLPVIDDFKRQLEQALTIANSKCGGLDDKYQSLMVDLVDKTPTHNEHGRKYAKNSRLFIQRLRLEATLKTVQELTALYDNSEIDSDELQAKLLALSTVNVRSCEDVNNGEARPYSPTV